MSPERLKELEHVYSAHHSSSPGARDAMELISQVRWLQSQLKSVIPPEGATLVPMVPMIELLEVREEGRRLQTDIENSSARELKHRTENAALREENATLKGKLSQYTQLKYARNHWAIQADELRDLLKESRSDFQSLKNCGNLKWANFAKEAMDRIDATLGAGSDSDNTALSPDGGGG